MLLLEQGLVELRCIWDKEVLRRLRQQIEQYRNP